MNRTNPVAKTDTACRTASGRAGSSRTPSASASVTAPAVDALAALDALKIDYRVLTHGPVHSVEEAAVALDAAGA